MKLFGTLSQRKIAGIVRKIQDHARNESWDDAWSGAQPLMTAQAENLDAADALAFLINDGAFDRERAAELAGSLLAAHSDHLGLISKLGEALESVRDMRYLNAPPPGHPVFSGVAERLLEAIDPIASCEDARAIEALATAARLLGRSWDDVAERAYLRLVELDPKSSHYPYGLGLFYKTRGRFAEGQAANQAASDLGGSERESVIWNLGICATGAGDGETALRIWKGLQQKIEIGRFDLPDGGYGMVKVRLAQRPLAERDPGEMPDDPGLEETIWIERLSPCHGIVRSALFQDEIGVDYGDVILFDGAPITHHQNQNGDPVPVFPHLKTLVRPGYLIYPFGGTQRGRGQIADLSRSLPADAVLYVHTEQSRLLCNQCWETPGLCNTHQDPAEHHVVTGKLCMPPSMEPKELLSQLDELLPAHSGIRVFAPSLSLATGDEHRADVESRRMNMLKSDT